MKTLYLECNMGAAGDMLAAALLELHPQPEDFAARLNQLGLPGVVIRRERAVTCGITGSRLSVVVNGEEEESQDVEHSLEYSCEEHTHEHDCTEHTHSHAHSHEAHLHEHGHGHSHKEALCEHSHEHSHKETLCEHDHGHSHEEALCEHRHEHSHQDAHGHGHHHHAGMDDISRIIDSLNIPEEVKADANAVYTLIAEAESHAHGRSMDEIHFHEVGTLDAVADIVSVCLLMHELAPEQVVVSPVHVGSGQVRCAHGILPVPAPATAFILRGVPVYGGQIRGELCTPTGAALLKHFADSFGSLPLMKIEQIGYGIGKKQFEAANCVRAMLGESLS